MACWRGWRQAGHHHAGHPDRGAGYYQEYGIASSALDMGRVSMVGASVNLDGMAFDDVVIVLDSNPVESGASALAVETW